MPETHRYPLTKPRVRCHGPWAPYGSKFSVELPGQPLRHYTWTWRAAMTLALAWCKQQAAASQSDRPR